MRDEPRRRVIPHPSSLIPLLIVACAAPAPKPQTAPPPPPARLTATAHAQRVVLVSFDGLSADAVARFGVPALERMSARVSRVVPVNPTATSSTHAAILTGEPPEKSGIVSNQFHRRGTPAEETARGLDTEIDADTIVDVARRAGKRVGCIEFPFLDTRSPRRTCDFGTTWPATVAKSRIVHFSRGDFRAEWLPPSWGAPAPPRHPSFSPVLRARFEWSVPERLREDADLVAYDTTDDHVTNYDALYVETRSGEIPVGADGWFALSARAGEQLYGCWSKVLRRDASLDALTLYLGSVATTNAYAAVFREAVEHDAGFVPAPADEPRARDWIAGGDGIDPQTFAEELERYTAFQTKVTLLAIARMPFDLLLSYQPVADVAEHQFAIEHETQLYATPEHRAAAVGVLRAAYASVNRAAAAMTGAIDPARDAIVITGDHGYMPFDVEVRLNTILPPNWRAYANGNVAHLYRFGGAADDDAVVNLLTNFRAADGSAVFEKIERRTPASHTNAGDIVAYGWPRFALSNAGGETFARVPSYGQHGGLNSHHEFDTTLAATGAGVPAMQLETMPQTAVASFIEEILGVEGRSQKAEGRSR
jgi:hypothetical protein